MDKYILSNEEKRQFDEIGYIVKTNVIPKDLINECIIAYERMREKCEKKSYLHYRTYPAISFNDIYAIEDIFHPDIFEEPIFQAIINSNILEISQELMQTDDVFLNLTRLHCTKNISHSGFWHRDHGSTKSRTKYKNIIDENLIKNQASYMQIQATIPFYNENGFYVIPKSHKKTDNSFISTNQILGTKKILNNETLIKFNAGDLLVFNPYLIHRGTCSGHIKNQRAHLHLRFSKRKEASTLSRSKNDFDYFNESKVIEMCNKNWIKIFKDDLPDPESWRQEIIQNKDQKASFGRKLVIIINRFFYYLSFFYPLNFRKLEQIKFLKYPYLKNNS